MAESGLTRRLRSWRAAERWILGRGDVEDLLPGRTRAGVAPAALSPEDRAAWNWTLSWPTLCRDLEATLLEALGRERLVASGVDLNRALSSIRSWPEARRRLRLARAVEYPSELLAELADVARCEALLADCADPLAYGVRLGRYAERVAELARLAPAGPALDVGCATGEGAWELAAARGGPVLGTDVCPLLIELARARRVPHDPERERALRELAGGLDPARVSFAVADVRQPPPGRFALIACHGVLGEGVRGDDVPLALDALVGALLPGGVLSLAHRFREDRATAFEAALAAAIERHGLEVLAPDLVRAPASLR